MRSVMNFAKLAAVATIAASLFITGCGEKTKIVVLMGQSNMVGTNKTDYIPETNIRVRALTLDNRLVVAGENLYSGSSSHKELLPMKEGVSLGTEFGKLYSNFLKPDEEVVLVPCARGMSTMKEQVEPGTTNFFGIKFEKSLLQVCVDRAKIASNLTGGGQVHAVLYYQGEADAYMARSFPSAEKQLHTEWELGVLKIKRTFKEAFGTERFAFAQLATVDDETVSGQWNRFKAMQEAVSVKHNIPMVKTDDLSMEQDELHLDAKAAREVGYRFAEALKNIFIN